MTQISKTADQALRLLTHLADEGAATALDLSRALDLNRTVVHRLLKTLEHRGFVTHEGSSYRVGTAALRVAGQVESGLRALAASGLEQLCELFSETVILSVPDGVEAVLVDQRLSSRRDAQIRYGIGLRHSLAYSGHGRAILAFSSDGLVEEVLALTDDDQVEWLRAALDEVRERGYAFSKNELRSGISGLAAPILDHHGRARASIGVVSPTGRFPDPDDVAAETQKIAAEISERLGGQY